MGCQICSLHQENILLGTTSFCWDNHVSSLLDWSNSKQLHAEYGCILKALVIGRDCQMNYEIYTAALRIIELVNRDSRLCSQASGYGDWHNNLLEHLCDFEADNLEMCLVLRALRKQMSDYA